MSCVCCKGAVLRANTENQDLTHHTNDLETRVAILEKELATLKKQYEEESQEVTKRDEGLTSQANSLATSLLGNYFLSLVLTIAYRCHFLT